MKVTVLASHECSFVGDPKNLVLSLSDEGDEVLSGTSVGLLTSGGVKVAMVTSNFVGLDAENITTNYEKLTVNEETEQVANSNSSEYLYFYTSGLYELNIFVSYSNDMNRSLFSGERQKTINLNCFLL